MKQRFSKEVIDLFESLAPDDDEVLNELYGLSEIPLDVELKQDQRGSERFLRPISAGLGNRPSQTSADAVTDGVGNTGGDSGRRNLVDHACSVISKLLYAMMGVPPTLDAVGAAASHLREPTTDRHPSETVALRWQQVEETYELYYLEPDRNKAYVRCIQVPAAVLAKTKLLINDKTFALFAEGEHVYARWPLTAFVRLCTSMSADGSALESKLLPWIS